jgi:hypothetical protein
VNDERELDVARDGQRQCAGRDSSAGVERKGHRHSKYPADARERGDAPGQSADPWAESDAIDLS